MQEAIGNSRVFPLSHKLFQSEFYLTHVGWEVVTPNQPYPHPRHPGYYGFKWQEGRILGEFCFNLITSGEGEVHTKDGKQIVRAGQAILCKPGEWHRHRPNKATGWTNLWVNFNGALPREWLKDGAFRLNKNIIEISDPEIFEAKFRQLVEKLSANELERCDYANELSSCFSHLIPSSDPAKLDIEPPRDPIISAALNYIWNHNEPVIGVNEISEHTSVHRRTLERHFASGFGNTILSEIHWCSLSRAALLLRETDARIKYIVDRSGFGGYQRLRLAFQKYFGVSPREYREYYQSPEIALESHVAEPAPSNLFAMMGETEFQASEAA